MIIYEAYKYYFRFQKSIANKCQRRLKKLCQEQNARRCPTKDAKISQSMSLEKSAKSSPRLSALRIQSMSRRKSPRSIVSRYPRRSATPSPGLLSRMSLRKSARRSVTAPRWTPMVTPAPMRRPPMITSPHTRPPLRPQVTRLRLRLPATAPRMSTGRPKPPRHRDTALRPPPTMVTRDWLHKGECRVWSNIQRQMQVLMDICMFQAVFGIFSELFSANKCGQLGSWSRLDGGSVISGLCNRRKHVIRCIKSVVREEKIT